MSKVTEPTVNRIAIPVAESEVQAPPPQLVIHRLPRPVLRQWAPAWFFSALNWLGKSYADAGNVTQSFTPYLAGSDVDPYAELGATRLFVITYQRERFRMTLAADANSQAALTGGKWYAANDEGITEMYRDLAASVIFSSVKYCYVPGRIGPDLDANATLGEFVSGYDPASGLRAMVLGSAVAQAVPLDDFLKTHNEQIYDESPTIVPLVTALVYDIRQYNTLGATTYLLPVYYTRDQLTPGTFYVSRFKAAVTANGETVSCGQTAVFPGGPGYNDAAATALTLTSTVVGPSSGTPFRKYTFTTATVVTTGTVAPRVETGVVSFTYAGASPQSVFANQRIVGFYRDSSWTTCLGTPIYDFGAQNAN